ncbi:carbohydrate kinase [Rhodobacteraceae bacterium]|nr:carbohydrate kinase [Paracoccaceae bacterium]
MTPRHIAVIDIGKTNAKLALVDGESLTELAVETRPNTVLCGPPWPHFDLEGHWIFLRDALARMQAAHGIDAISVTTHGAACVLLDQAGDLAAPMLDYEYKGPDDLRAQYDALRPGFHETGSPRLPAGLNLGAQLHWQFATDPDLAARCAHVVTYPQYWGFRLTGNFATDVTSLGCHSDLWNPWTGMPSSLVDKLGLSGKLAPARKSSDIIGTVSPEVAAQTGLSTSTPVACGIHDSNASLYPYLCAAHAANDGPKPSDQPFSVVSTGTWVVAMAVGGTDGRNLDPARDTLVNVNALGNPVPSARFMGGREFEVIRQGISGAPTPADRAAVLDGIFLLPAIEPATGPFPDRRGGFSRQPRTPGARLLALSWYLALMTDQCLDLIGAKGPVIIEGPFGRNRDFLEMLGCLRPDPVEAAQSATGTSVGSAMLFIPAHTAQPGTRIHSMEPEKLRDYAQRWRAMTAQAHAGETA